MSLLSFLLSLAFWSSLGYEHYDARLLLSPVVPAGSC